MKPLTLMDDTQMCRAREYDLLFSTQCKSDGSQDFVGRRRWWRFGGKIYDIRKISASTRKFMWEPEQDISVVVAEDFLDEAVGVQCSWAREQVYDVVVAFGADILYSRWTLSGCPDTCELHLISESVLKGFGDMLTFMLRRVVLLAIAMGVDVMVYYAVVMRWESRTLSRIKYYPWTKPGSR